MQHRDTGRLAGLFTPTRPVGARREPTVDLVCNPADDAAFRRAAETFLAAGAASPAGLQRLLGQRYPQVVVRPRALSDEHIEAWYVYRDGSWTRSGVAAREGR